MPVLRRTWWGGTRRRSRKGGRTRGLSAERGRRPSGRGRRRGSGLGCKCRAAGPRSDGCGRRRPRPPVGGAEDDGADDVPEGASRPSPPPSRPGPDPGVGVRRRPGAPPRRLRPVRLRDLRGFSAASSISPSQPHQLRDASPCHPPSLLQESRRLRPPCDAHRTRVAPRRRKNGRAGRLTEYNPASFTKGRDEGAARGGEAGRSRRQGRGPAAGKHKRRTAAPERTGLVPALRLAARGLASHPTPSRRVRVLYASGGRHPPSP